MSRTTLGWLSFLRIAISKYTFSSGLAVGLAATFRALGPLGGGLPKDQITESVTQHAKALAYTKIAD